MNLQTRIKRQDQQSQAYQAGQRDYLNCEAVVRYGQFSVGPPESAKKTWLREYHLYRRGWYTT